MKFTGEFFIPEKTEKRIQDDHYSRYIFAGNYVNGKNILDIACGVGYGSQLIGNSFQSYTGVDINPESIQYATEKYGGDKIKYYCSDILDFSRGPFDVIISFETIEHVSKYKEALQALYKNLKPNGTLIISSPNRAITSPMARTLKDKPANKFHTQEFLPQELINELIALGFKSENISLFGQRQEYVFKNNILKKLYNRFFDPQIKSSPLVKPIKNKQPRYFILVAKNG